MRRLEQVCRRRPVFLSASVTLECALVLPLFFMAVLTTALFMEAVRQQTGSSLRLSNEARKLSAAAGALPEDDAGRAGWIDLAEKEVFQYPFGVLRVPKLAFAVRARVYPWTGWPGGIGGDNSGSGGDAGIVYLTDNEEVWHSHPDCTHLDLSVFRSTVSAVSSMRNAYGRKYRPCPGFPEGYSGPVWLTEKGDYYYPGPDYPGLTRHVHAVRRSEAGSLGKCERCAERDAA